MGRKFIVGIDPGDSTGLAVLEYFEDDYPTVLWSETIPDGVNGFIDRFLEYESDSNLLDGVTVSEKFIVRPGFVGDSEALKIEGVLALLRPDTVYQMPAMKRSLVFTAKTEAGRFRWLRNHGYNGITDHEMDAITHALLYLKGQGNRGVLSLYKKDVNNG